MYPPMHNTEKYPWLGKRCPNFSIYAQDQNNHTLYEVMHDGKFILLIHPSDVDMVDKINIDSHIRVIVGQIQHSELEKISAVWIRPDGHIAWIAHTKNDVSLGIEKCKITCNSICY